MTRHIVHEPWTRELLGIVGSERQIAPIDPRVSWCGTRISATEWAFVDATHALLSIQQGSAISACPSCVAAIAGIAIGELQRVGVPAPGPETTIEEIIQRRKAR